MGRQGLFIAFEGGEGSGKTTLQTAVAAALTAEGVPHLSLREPGGTALGEAIRALLLDKNLGLDIDSKAELCLFLAARSQNILENIAPALNAGKVVLCDRFNASTIAYQGYARALGIKTVTGLCNWISGPIVPDVTFYLDLDPLVGLQRSRALMKEHAPAGTADRMESEQADFHLAVREGFRQLAEQAGEAFITIDASQSKEAVFDHVWAQIMHRWQLL